MRKDVRRRFDARLGLTSSISDGPSLRLRACRLRQSRRPKTGLSEDANGHAGFPLSPRRLSPCRRPLAGSTVKAFPPIRPSAGRPGLRWSVEMSETAIARSKYDPATGSFVSTDPASPSLSDPYVSSYLYARNNPVLFQDPSGKDCTTDILQLAGCGFGAVVGFGQAAVGVGQIAVESTAAFALAGTVVLGALLAGDTPQQNVQYCPPPVGPRQDGTESFKFPGGYAQLGRLLSPSRLSSP